MQKSGIEYSFQTAGNSVKIETLPGKNAVTQKNIEPALGKLETCVNSSPGRFSVIQTAIKVYKVRVKRQNIES